MQVCGFCADYSLPVTSCPLRGLFLTRGYARAYHELLQGLRYESLTHSLVVDALRMLKLRFDRYIRVEVLPNLRQAGIFQISTIQKPLTRPGVKLDKKMSICSSIPSTSTLA